MKTFLVFLVLAFGRLSAKADDVIDLIMDVHSPWKELSVTVIHDCRCLGPVLVQCVTFKQERPNEISLMTWQLKGMPQSKDRVETPWRKLKDYSATELRDDVVNLLRAAIASTSLAKRYNHMPSEKRADFLSKLTLEQQASLRESEEGKHLTISVSLKDGSQNKYNEVFVDGQFSILAGWVTKVAPEAGTGSYP